MKTRILLPFRKTAYAILLVSLFACSPNPERPATGKPAIIGYVGGYRGLVDTDKISADKLTHINYAFVNLVDGRATLTNEKTDTVNFRRLNDLKNVNPDLKILISIGMREKIRDVKGISMPI